MLAMKFPLQNVHHNLAGFSALSQLHTEAGVRSSIEVDMQATSWIDADMCAPFGAVYPCFGEQTCHGEAD